jgi:hypothetical protein
MLAPAASAKTTQARTLIVGHGTSLNPGSATVAAVSAVDQASGVFIVRDFGFGDLAGRVTCVDLYRDSVLLRRSG